MNAQAIITRLMLEGWSQNLIAFASALDKSTVCRLRSGERRPGFKAETKLKELWLSSRSGQINADIAKRIRSNAKR